MDQDNFIHILSLGIQTIVVIRMFGNIIKTNDLPLNQYKLKLFDLNNDRLEYIKADNIKLRPNTIADTELVYKNLAIFEISGIYLSVVNQD